MLSGRRPSVANQVHAFLILEMVHETIQPQFDEFKRSSEGSGFPEGALVAGSFQPPFARNDSSLKGKHGMMGLCQIE